MLAARELPITKRVPRKGADPYVLLYLDAPGDQCAVDADPAGAAALAGYLGRTETKWGERWPRWAAVGGEGTGATNALHVDSKTGELMKEEQGGRGARTPMLGPGGTAHAFVLHHLRDVRCRLRLVLMDAANKGGTLGQDAPLGTAVITLGPLLHQVRRGEMALLLRCCLLFAACWRFTAC